jgi:hypothetical protein
LRESHERSAQSVNAGDHVDGSRSVDDQDALQWLSCSIEEKLHLCGRVTFCRSRICILHNDSSIAAELTIDLPLWPARPMCRYVNDVPYH